MTLKRRTFLAATAAAAPAALAAPAVARNRRTLQMVMSWSHNLPGLAVIAYDFARFTEALTDGEVTVDVAAAGELVGPLEVFDAVGSGAADCYHSTPIYLAGQWRASAFFGQVPFGLTALEHLGWMYHGGGQDLQHRHFRELFNLICFTAGQTGIQMGGWFNREINSLEDFRGLTMRMPGLAGEVMRRVGVNAMMIPAQEIFPALQAGTIDATALQGPWLDTVSGFQQHARYYYAPGWQEVNSAGEVGFNADLWDELPDRHKQAMEHAIQAANSINCGAWAYNNAIFFETLRNEHDVDVRVFPDDVIDALATASNDLLVEIGQDDERAAEVFESYDTFFRQVATYSVATEVPFFKARERQMTRI